ncbi:MAG: metalloregulator ArsR/SmtB family transcription factor [Rhodopseudomonas palustris]|nr:metalloregulator ArsR/SmtB family transcription factor [Rhodopseudomonas palustris]
MAVTPEGVTLREIEAMSDLFFQASDPTRLTILLHLNAAESRCVCELAAEMGMSISAVSHQMKKLRLSGLVERRREGRHIHYTLADDHVQKLRTSASST